ncbi:MAG: transcription termination/antitermination protein NusG [Candidatus Paceibacterota bacterium]|jgi:transcriptional antiterminator NusG|nr:transcription termination/antitermination protein NusG [Candidatus Paceibacterota bacterium]MDD3548722.1 transcription termination/antitermination protein NusG [Candidatus Paceibacterota bacterium]MDD4999107.1 transcription termination/antitermination protein NusG [Candidatus Paceibacterota bacterium]MDD5545331.1 transcription termination/antitermination protein NusG [Candidatus Paceibacterota bacterium]
MPKQQINLGRNWYVIHTYSGYEDAVARSLKQRVEALGMQDKIFNVLVPKEKKIKIKSGKRTIVEEKIYPGYIFVDMIVTDDSWYVVRNTPMVTGFIGAGTTPRPVQETEMRDILKKTGEEEPKYKIDFSLGDLVKIMDGPFKGKEGKVGEIDQARGRVKILVSLFGRDTPIDLDFLQVKKS